MYLNFCYKCQKKSCMNDVHFASETWNWQSDKDSLTKLRDGTILKFYSRVVLIRPSWLSSCRRSFSSEGTHISYRSPTVHFHFISSLISADSFEWIMGKHKHILMDGKRFGTVICGSWVELYSQSNNDFSNSVISRFWAKVDNVAYAFDLEQYRMNGRQLRNAPSQISPLRSPQMSEKM